LQPTGSAGTHRELSARQESAASPTIGILRRPKDKDADPHVRVDAVRPPPRATQRIPMLGDVATLLRRRAGYETAARKNLR
jgi:hypothetical protein